MRLCREEFVENVVIVAVGIALVLLAGALAVALVYAVVAVPVGP